ncbi:MAG: putative phosphoglycolate phosphatase [Deltaproteobacteria bacterium]|nr:putative phosphoglycolate phosphatase [Deltaproteobacteria bacterium]
MKIFFGSRLFETRGLFFDKDGTLVDLHHQYSTLMDKRAEKILIRYPQEGGFRRALCRAVGYDPESRTIAHGGPLAVATREQTLEIVSNFLAGQGLSGEKAERIARESFQLADRELGWEELIRPMEGLTALLSSLGGLKVAEFFQLVLGGDEVSRPKPDAEMIQEACRRLGLHPREIVYVGDTVSDMIMARRAGAGLAVAVLGGAADESILAAEADVVISNLRAISVSGET